MWRKILFGTVTALLIAVVGLAGYWFGMQSQSTPTITSQPTPSNPANDTPAPPAEQPAQTTTPQTYTVSVFFSKHPESDDDPSRVFPVQRTTDSIKVGTFALQELIKGPTQNEKTTGYFSYVRLRDGASTCGGDDLSLAIVDGVATLRFCRPFDHLGSVSDGQAESTINATLKQFSTVKKVIILNSTGNCEFDLSGLGLCKQ